MRHLLASLLPALLATQGWTQVTHDSAAPGNTRPTVLVAPNGVPLVNIQTPSAAGVSRNRFSQFDVDRRGVILNNSRVNTPTVLGGWVQGNPWLATGSASLILNEVNSSNPSQLRGYLEVAGPRAQVVVANPSGILCEGCGFINAGRATLAAAPPVFAEGPQGRLTGWGPGSGTLQVAGAGLDGAGLDHASLIAQAIRVDAQVRVDGRLQAVAGAQAVALDGQGEVDTATPADPSSRPAVALDVSRLGGMYAGRITLVGHGAGVGVRNAGAVGAVLGELVVTASGRLENSGTLQAAGALQLQGQGGVRNTGTLRAGGPLGVRSAGDIEQAGTAAAGADLRLALEGPGLLSSGPDSLTLAGLRADASLGSTGQVEAVAPGGTLRLQGRWSAGARLALEGGQADLSGSVLRAPDIAISAHDGDISLASADVRAPQALALRAQQALVIDGAWVETPRLGLAARSLSNRSGTLLLTGSEDQALALAGDLDNRGGAIVSPEGALWLSARAVDNRAGLIGAGTQVQLQSDRLDNRQGQVLGPGSLGLRVAEVDNRDGALLAGQQLRLEASALSNQGGRIHSDAALDAVLAGDPTPDGLWGAGTRLSLRAAGRMQLGTASFEAPELRIEADSLGLAPGSSLGAARLQLKASGARGLDNQGRVSGDLVDITGTRWDNSGQVDGKTVLVSVDALDNRGQVTGERLQISAPALDNRGLLDGREVRIDTHALDNRGGGRIYGDSLSLSAHDLGNRAEYGQAPVIAARDALDLGVQRLVNAEHALIFSAGELALGGSLDGARRATGQAESLRNSSATVEALGALRLSAAQVVNEDLHFRTATLLLPTERVREYQPADGGPRYAVGTPGLYVQNEESDHLYTPDGGRTDHWYDYDYTRTVFESRVVASDPGRILSGGDMRLDAGRIRNDKGQIVAGGRLLTQAGSLENVAVPGTRRVEEMGSVTEVWRVKRKGWDTTGRDSTPYSPPHRVTTLDLGASQALEFSQPASGNRAPAGGVGAGAAAGSGGAGSGSGSAGGPVAAPLAGLQIPSAVSSAGASVRSLPVDLRLPDSSLFRLLPEPTSHYLVETDPRFTDGRRWLGSDYLMNALGIRPADTLRRLGDGFYEQRLIREQVTALTGQRRLAGYADDEAQFRALMDAGLTVAQRLGLVPGVVLSAEQVAQLSSDIVWLVARDVTLPDGSRTQVLVPQLYVKVREGDLTPAGSLIAASQADIQVSGDLWNGGTLAGREVLTLSAQDLRNRGRVDGQVVSLRAATDIDNTGGRISASQALVLDAGRDIRLASTVSAQAGPQGERVVLDRVAGLYVTGEGGALVARAGRDLQITGAVVRSEGSASLDAGRDLMADTLQTRSSQSLVWNADNRHSEAVTQEVGSSVSAQGELQLRAGNDIRGRALQARSDEGQALLQAGRDLLLTAAQSTEQVDAAHKHSSTNHFTKETVRTESHLAQTTVQGSQVEGRQVLIEAGRDVRGAGAQVVSDTHTALHAGRDVDLGAAQETVNQQSVLDVKRSGAWGSGGTGFTIGTQRSTTEQVSRETRSVKSAAGSLSGDIEIRAGGSYASSGIDLVAPQGSVAVQAQRIAVTEARDTRQSHSSTQTRQTGLTVAISNPVISAVQTTEHMSRAAGDTGSARMQALAAAASVLAVREAAQAVAKDPALGGGVSFSASIGTSRSRSESTESADQAVASRIVAGRDLSLRATGAGGESDVLLRGVDVKVGGRVSLEAEHRVQLEAASSSTRQHSTERSSSASLGVTAGLGPQGAQAGVTVGVSGGKARADGEDLAWTNTQISAGRQVTVRSGGDTVLAGAVLRAPQIVGEIGGQLVVESRQDRSHYESKRAQASANATVGPAPSGGVGGGGSKVGSDFASVAEQSAIRAGDGGFQIEAQGGVRLQGGAITSSAIARDAGLNRLVTPTRLLSDITNQADFQASAASANVGAAFSPEGKAVPGGTSAGVGSDRGHARSVTRAAITGIAGDSAALTGDAETGIKPIFDGGRVQREVEGQVAITAAAGQRGAKAWGEYATGKYVEALQAGDAAGQACWASTGACRSVGHALMGAATGGTAGAAGAAAAAQVAPRLGDALRNAGVKDDTAKLLVDLGVAAGGLALGGPQSGAAALNEADNNSGLFGRLLARAALTGGPMAARACRADPSCWSAVVGMGATTVAVLSQIADLNQPIGAPGFASGDQPMPGRGTALPDPGPGRGTRTSTPIAEDLSADARTRGREFVDRPPLDLILGRPPTEQPVPNIVLSSSGNGKNPAGKSPFGSAEIEQRLDALGPLPPLIDREAARHILFGDDPGSGGHAHPGQPGKTPFPVGWGDPRILEAASEIATNPSTPWRRSSDGRYELSEQMRDGVEIRVVLNPASRRIVSAYPVNLPRNPK